MTVLFLYCPYEKGSIVSGDCYIGRPQAEHKALVLVRVNKAQTLRPAVVKSRQNRQFCNRRFRGKHPEEAFQAQRRRPLPSITH